MFRYAGQPDVYRAWQKDEASLREFREEAQELSNNMFGGRRSSQYRSQIDLVANACYYGLTTLIGNQTLGEEYTDIMTVTTNMRMPTFRRRLALVLMQVLSPFLYDHLVNNSRAVEVDSDQSWLRRLGLSLWNKVLRAVRSTKPLLSTLQRTHLMLFYLFGTYLRFSHRIAGLRYLFLRKLHMPRPGYQLLGLLIFVQFVVTVTLKLKDRWRARARTMEEARRQLLREGLVISTQLAPEEDDEDEDENSSCSLCLCPRTHTTATECGHLFCWECISAACNNKPECPLCRQPQALSSLLRLYNYRKQA